MTRTVYVNGRYLPYRQAMVHAEDRGFQFADAVYEVCEVRRGRLVDETRHMQRLARSLGELGIPPPMTPGA
jgi:D-alanine transaminase